MNAAEHAAEAERLVLHVANWGNESFATGTPDQTPERALAMAQVHATLATIPDTYELTVGTDEVRTDPAIRVGDRVVFMGANHSPSGRRYLGSDSLGTVVLFQFVDGDRTTARVDFDDIGEQWIGLDDLRVVLDA